MGVKALLDCFDDTFRGEIHKSTYLMIDETCELVGVKDENSGEVSYRKKYLWVFLGKVTKLINYIYEKGNRGLWGVENYLKDNFRNFILDGKVEISNNLIEQRMKPIKLDLKNSKNIGSEDVAKRHAFMHSLIESCSMKVPSYEYLVNLLEKYKTLTEEEKLALMPCYYKK